MPPMDLSRYKVVYEDKVIRALAIMDVRFMGDDYPSPEKPSVKPAYVTVMVINADGVLEALTGKAEEFQFIPVLSL